MQISREPTVWRSYLRLPSFVDLSWQGLWYSFVLDLSVTQAACNALRNLLVFVLMPLEGTTSMDIGQSFSLRSTGLSEPGELLGTEQV